MGLGCRLESSLNDVCFIPQSQCLCFLTLHLFLLNRDLDSLQFLTLLLV